MNDSLRTDVVVVGCTCEETSVVCDESDSTGGTAERGTHGSFVGTGDFTPDGTENCTV